MQGAGSEPRFEGRLSPAVVWTMEDLTQGLTKSIANYMRDELRWVMGDSGTGCACIASNRPLTLVATFDGTDEKRTAGGVLDSIPPAA